MKPDFQQLIAGARAGLRQKNTLVLGDQWYAVRTLLDVEAWRKRRKGLSAYDVFAEDDCGNEFLVAAGGQVYFWDHENSDLCQLAESLGEFLRALGPQPETKLEPGQVKKVWIDPAFLEQQRRSGNTKG